MKITGNQRVIDILTRRRAFRKGHFVLNAGDHSPDYVDKDMVGVGPYDLNTVGVEIAKKCQYNNIQVVVGPMAGGVGLAYFVAYHLGEDVPVIYADKNGDGFKIERAAHLDVLRDNDGDILVVEDILTTGGSAERVVTALFQALGNLWAEHDADNLHPAIDVFAICNRGNVRNINGTRYLNCLVEVTDIEKYPADQCPLCAAKVPIDTDRGHGAKFLKEQAAKEIGTSKISPLQQITLESGGNDADLGPESVS